MFPLVCAALLGSPPQASLTTAVARAEKKVPSAAWSTTRTVIADFTFDGSPDVALLGHADDGVTVAVVEGPTSARSRVLLLRFQASAGSQDGICGPPSEARIEVEPPGLVEGCDAGNAACATLAKRLRAAARKGGKGLALVSGECDSFHVVFDGAQLVWTRR